MIIAFRISKSDGLKQFCLCIILTILFLPELIHAVYGQKKVKLEKADRLEGGKQNGRRFDSFIGNVVFYHEGINIFCDSAVFCNKENSLEAYGNVIIDDNDSVVVTSGRLIYDGDSKIARLREKVVFEKLGEMTLYTDFLNYNRDIELATYFEGGKSVDSSNE